MLALIFNVIICPSWDCPSYSCEWDLIAEMGNTWPGDMSAQESGNLQMLRYDKIA